MAPAMLCKTCKKSSMERPVARLMISSLSLHVSWKPVNPQECVWKNLYRNIMRTTSQEKGTIRYSISMWYTIFSYASSNAETRSKSSSGYRMGTFWKRFLRGTEQVRNKSEVIDEARKEGRKVHFASLMDLCHLKKSNWRQSTKHTKIELYSEATLWKMILDRMQYSFIEQRSSASQMTAAKVMDIISRLPRMRRTSSGRYIGFFPGKMEDAPKLLKIPKIGMSIHLDSSTTTHMA